MILSVGVVALASLAFGWLYRVITSSGKCGWLTEVALPGVLVGYSAVVMLPGLSATGSSALSLLAATLLSLAAGLLFDRDSPVESGGEELRGRRNTWPLLIWGAGALAYIGVPLADYVSGWKGVLEGLTGGMVGVGAGAMLGQALSWVRRLLAARAPEAAGGVRSSSAGSRSGLNRIGGSVAAVLALWLLLPSIGGGITGGGAKAPPDSFLVGMGALDNKPIYVLDSTASSSRTLSATGGRARWSPDGTRMAFTHKEGGFMQGFVAAADGSNPAQLTQAPGDVVDCAWSADGQRIYFLHGKSFLQSELSVVSATGGSLEEVLPASQAVNFPTISPDGRTLAYFRGIDFSAGVVAPPKEIKLLDLATRQATVVVSQPSNDWNVTALTWTPDGQALILSAQSVDKGPHQLQRLSLAERKLQPWGDPFNYYLASFTWTAGGASLAVLAYPEIGGNHGKAEIWQVDPATGGHRALRSASIPDTANSIHASP